MARYNWQAGEQGNLTIGDAVLEAACFGPAPESAPTIVMLHEGLGCVALWRDFPQKLAEKTGCGVFVYSRAGYGQSTPCSLPRPIDYMTREAMDVLPQVLDAIGFKQGILLGHSDGATIAAIHAGMSGGHRVRGLVLIAPHFFTEESGLKSIAQAREDYDKGILREKLAKYHADVNCAFRGWNNAWLDPKFKDWNVAECIDYLRIPVLAIQGNGDQYGSLAQISEIENRIYSPVETVILEQCGHSPHIEQSDKTLSAVAEFAQRLMRLEKAQVQTVFPVNYVSAN